MATNAKNLAELLNTDTTVKVGDIEDGSVTTAKLAASAVTTAKVADSAVTGAKLFADNLGRRNILINGAFQHWQRGTSFSANGYGSDRWKLYAPGGHAYARSTDTPDSPNNFEYSASVGGSGDATGLTQFVESRNAKHIPSSGSTKVILSFYLKHTTNSGANKITSVVGTLDSADNSGVSTNRSVQNHTTTNSWARYTHEMTGADLTTAVTNGLFITIKHNGSGTTAFLLTGCQLEINETVTDFERRGVGEELQSCQRYYIDTRSGGSSYGGCSMSRSVYDYKAYGFNAFPVEMRVKPTVTFYDGSGNAGALTEDGAGHNRACTAAFHSKHGINGATSSGGGSGHFSSSAGAGYHIQGTYTADAEL